MKNTHSGHIAVRLNTGKVLVAGGGGPSEAGAKLYNPLTKSWSLTGSLKTGRDDFSAVLLQNGEVCAAGGASRGHDLGQRRTLQSHGRNLVEHWEDGHRTYGVYFDSLD